MPTAIHRGKCLRAQQLLQQPIDMDGTFSLVSHRKLLVNQCVSLKDFNYKLALTLINSWEDPNLQNVLIANPNRAAAQAQNEVAVDTQLGIV